MESVGDCLYRAQSIRCLYPLAKEFMEIFVELLTRRTSCSIRYFEVLLYAWDSPDRR